MQKNKIKTTGKLHIRSSKKRNGIEPKQNIFQLIENIPKERFFVVGKTIDVAFKIAENMIAFLEQTYPDFLDTLEFDTVHDDISHLHGKLIEAINQKGHYICFPDEDEIDGSFMILTPIDFEISWLQLNASLIRKIKNQKLRIGYAHVLKKAAKHFSIDHLSYDYESPDDSPFEFEIESFIEGVAYEKAEEKAKELGVDEYDISEFYDEEIGYELLYGLKKQKDAFQKYLNQDIKEFYDYKPRTKEMRLFKEFLIEGLEHIDFNILNRFYNDEDVYEDCIYSFSDTTMVIFEDNNDLIERYFQGLDEATYNGCSNPCTAIEVKNRKLYPKNTQEQVDDCKAMISWVDNIYNDFLNKWKLSKR